METPGCPKFKSPISLVHEIAAKRNLKVAFEVLSDKGPSHMKVFTTRCRVGDFETQGEGNCKKTSKKRAAEKMLEELSKLGPLPNTTNLKEGIDPITRLNQIQQANKEKEPVYTVVEEPSPCEFVIEASVNGHISTGVGPTKKIAKRNAAEALLTLLGYANTPTPQSVPNPVCTVEKEVEPRKVEDKQENSVGCSGSPGRLLVDDQCAFQQNKAKLGDSEMLNLGSGSAPTEAKKIRQLQVPKKSPQMTQSVGAKNQLLHLAQLLGVQVQFSDFPKADTLVSLSTNPPQVFHGEGPTIEISQENAALEALNVLFELDLDNVTPNKENNSENIHGGGTSKPQVVPNAGLDQNRFKKEQ